MEKQQKTKQMESITNIKIGSNDSAGNKIIDVLASNNEYAIYEIDNHDINSKIKVYIDGASDESEMIIQDRFMKVKQKYIEAKGLLSKAENYGMMKHRIAHTLATCLNTDKIDGKIEFEQLITTIKNEHDTLVKNRIYYLVPCVFTVIILFFISLYLSASRNINDHVWIISWSVTTSLLSASLGGGLSMLMSAKTLNFEGMTSRLHYLMLGLERLVLACMAGAVAYIVIKSNIAFPSISKSNGWAFMTLLVLSGFSESFIPSILGKIKDKS